MKAKKEHLTGMPAVVAVILGVLCPLCFIAPLLITAGLGSVLALAVPWFKPLLVISLVFTIIAFSLSLRIHKNPLPLGLDLIGGSLMYYGGYIRFEQNLIYLGGILLIVAVGLDWWIRSKSKECLECKSDLHKHSYQRAQT